MTITNTTAVAHKPGSGCPACPTFTVWVDHHCYACGGVFATPVPGCVTGTENAEHAACFG